MVHVPRRKNFDVISSSRAKFTPEGKRFSVIEIEKIQNLASGIHEIREVINSGFTSIVLLFVFNAGEISNEERIEAVIIYSAESAI